MDHLPINATGLTADAVVASRAKYGSNLLSGKQRSNWWNTLRDTATEPMFVLLLVASIIYFISGQISEGVFMVAAILLVSGISFYQESKSKNALAALKKLTQPKTKVLRDGKTEFINSSDLVVEDVMIVEEGTSVSADGIITYSNDCTINEAILTGESLHAEKNTAEGFNQVFMGTSVATGMCIAVVSAVGNATRLGKIGTSLDNIHEEETPLQRQIGNFVKKMAIAGVVVFFIVWAINYFTQQPHDLMGSLLKALTLAMSILPEEIPVAFSTFMALGAWRLMKMGIIVRKTKTVETLGSATVICTDKTGTITENRMELVAVYVAASGELLQGESLFNNSGAALLEAAMFASEPLPFDPMEISLHAAYEKIMATDQRKVFLMVHEYPLGGTPPMMTHIFESSEGKRIIACKGALEKIIEVCKLAAPEREALALVLKGLTQKGYRILGVATAAFDGTDFLKSQEAYAFNFTGLVAFYDPPKANIAAVFNQFYEAGINLKIITGDTGATTQTIAKQTGFRNGELAIDGATLMKLSKEALYKTVLEINIFTRMFPEAKLAVINALKDQQQIVAMTGDGVNDGPALKAAHIGVAMGKKGTEIAKQAAELILENDDLSAMVDAVAMGRRIYGNLKKAIQYIISIHIPIILTVLIPLLLGWEYPAIFTPVHVIFLELIMGPTCSIVYENEPIEANLMQEPPRPYTTSFLNWRELSVSVLQGLAITVATLAVYQYAVGQGMDEAATRTVVFITLVAANIFLTLVNRSFFYSIFTTLQYKNRLLIGVICITIFLLAAMLYVPVINTFFSFHVPSIADLLIGTGVGFLAVIWMEGYKWMLRRKARSS